MARRTIDLAQHLNRDVSQGGPADFPVSLKPVAYRNNGSYETVANRLAVVREDTGEALGVVSDRYALVPHQRILDLVEEATQTLDVGPVPRGIYVDRRGARMRALYKFPDLREPVIGDETICPCIRVQNTYDGTSRIAVHIGAFHFVCTNLAVGGGGAFAGGFMAVHQGAIPIEDVTKQLCSYLSEFSAIVSLYRTWANEALEQASFEELVKELPKRPAKALRGLVAQRYAPTVYDAYDTATWYATHRMRSYHGAFDLLERVNRTFQEHYPPG